MRAISRSLLRRQLLGPRLAALRSQRLGGGILAVLFVLFLFLASGDAHNLDGVADHVGGALLPEAVAWTFTRGGDERWELAEERQLERIQQRMTLGW